jgi:hypothetical protein
MKHRHAKQTGVALIALVTVLVLGSSWWLYSRLGATANRLSLEQAQNAKVLAQAKEALLGWVAMHAADSNERHPGRLPCPEPQIHVNNPDYEGITAPYIPSGALTCSSIGRLPWRTLGVDKLRDAVGEPLWYAVTIGSNGWAFQNSGTVLSINANKLGGLRVDSQPNAAVAAIFAPGRVINVNPNPNQIAAGCATRLQNRSGSPPNSADYLECHDFATGNVRQAIIDNAPNAINATPVNNVPNTVSNDHVVFITAAEVMAAIEGPVMARMQQSVIPQLQAIYASGEWGTSSTAPIYPFPARFRDDAGTTFNPENYKGQRFGDDANAGPVALSQGLLPVIASACNSITTGRCDPNFVAWDLATVSLTQTGGSATSFNTNCSASTPTQIQCAINYSRASCFFCQINADVRVRATASNVGMTLKTLNAGAATGLSDPSLTAPLQGDGSARARYTGELRGGSAGWCGTVFPPNVSCIGSATITIPIAVFRDHPIVNPTSSDNWYWFTVNRWYDVTYYAVSPSHLLSGPSTHDCRIPVDCLAIANGTPPNNVRASIAFTGRSLTNAARPNADLADYFEDVSGIPLPATNRDADQAFAQGKISRKYNDRFLTLSNY